MYQYPAQPHPAAYYSPHHQYSGYAYDSVLQMAAGTPTGRRGQSVYPGYEDIGGAENEMASNMMGRNLNQVVPPSVPLGKHPGMGTKNKWVKMNEITV